MRLFIASEISPIAQKELQHLQKQLPNSITLTQDFHLTYKFLGEVAPDKLEEIRKALSSVEFKRFEVYIARLEAFPNKQDPKVVWSGIYPEHLAIELQQKIDNALASLFEKEKEFVPHITLGRAKDKAILPNVQPKMIFFYIENFKLIESQLTPKGPHYKELVIFKAQDAHE